MDHTKNVFLLFDLFLLLLNELVHVVLLFRQTSKELYSLLHINNWNSMSKLAKSTIKAQNPADWSCMYQIFCWVQNTLNIVNSIFKKTCKLNNNSYSLVIISAIITRMFLTIFLNNYTCLNTNTKTGWEIISLFEL